MRLLIITQSVDLDDAHLNFFHDWIKDFAYECVKVTVICLKKGRYDLPKNVEVLSLGKEEGVGRGTYVSRLFKYVWEKRKEYDAVFVHMNPEYLVLCGWLFKILNKKAYLWYIHRNVDMKLRIAEKFADHIFSSTKESFRIPSNKVEFVGHGINTNLFAYKPKNLHKKIKIISIGRITQIKNCEILIEAAGLLKEKLEKPFEIIFIGEVVTPQDLVYKEDLMKQIKENYLEEVVIFAGSVSNVALPSELYEADLSINMTPTGGMDKVVLESFSTGTLALTANEAFREVMAPYDAELLTEYRNPKDLAEKIKKLLEKDNSEKIVYFEKKMREQFSRPVLIKKIVKSFES